MTFDGFLWVEWGSMGSMWFAEGQSGSQGFFKVHLGSVRFNEFDGFFGVKCSMGLCGSLRFSVFRRFFDGSFGFCVGSMGSMVFLKLNGVLWVQCGSPDLFKVVRRGSLTFIWVL